MNVKTRSWWTLLVLLLLITFSLRVIALESVPPGLTHDEASNGHDSAAILRGVHRIYFPVGYGHEPLFNYSIAALTVFLGQGIFTLRFTAVLWSLLTWSLTVALTRRWYGRRAAIFAAALLTCTFWPLMLARVGLRAPVLPALFTASILCYDHALHARTPRRSLGAFLLSGVLLGACFYTYMASRSLPLVYLGLLIPFALCNRAHLRRAAWGSGMTIGVALLVGAPLFLHLRANPGLEYRLTQLSGPLTALRAGDWRPVWHNLIASLPFLGLRGDPLWLYNIGGRPSVDTLTAIAFWGGALIALWRWRDYRHTLLLLWLGGGLAPALLTGPDATALRAVAALPAIYILAVGGLEWVGRKIAESNQGVRFVATGAFVIVLLFTCSEAIHAYFITWGRDRDVHVLYHHHVVALGRYLDASPDTTPVAITSIYPGEFHDPYTMEVTLRRTDLSLRWSDGRSALFFPHGAARLYTEEQSALPPELSEPLSPTLTPETTLTFRPQDLPLAVYGYRWNADAAWDRITANLAQTVAVGPGDAAPGGNLILLTCPVSYGNVVALAGYTVTPTTLTPGSTLTVMTAWDVLAAHPEELVLFVHLLDGHNTILTQVDRLDAPSWQWQPGDRFVQMYRLTLPDAIPPGDYGLSFGFYRRTDFQRLPVIDAGMENVNHIIVPLIRK